MVIVKLVHPGGLTIDYKILTHPTRKNNLKTRYIYSLLFIYVDIYRYGPFTNYYDSWFGELRKAIDYKNKRVCFKEIYLKPEPIVGYFWQNWRQQNQCGLLGPSPLHQSFNIYFRMQWLRKYGQSSLKYPGNNIFIIYVHISCYIHTYTVSDD